MRRMRAAALGFALVLTSIVHLPSVGHAQVRQGFQPNFQDADLAYVFTALAQAAGINIIHSGLPARSVTLRSQTPVAQADIIGLIYSLAAANGVSITEGNGFLRLQGGGADVGLPQDMRQLFIYRLRHARAPQLSQTLQALFSGGNLPQRQTGPQTLSQQIVTLQQQQQQLQRPQQVVVGGISGVLQQAVVIIPDESTNSLLIRATPADYQILQQAIQGLDIRPLQVLIEVVIAEVRRSRNEHIGVSVSGINRDRPRTGDEVTVTTPQTATENDFSLKIIRTGEVNVVATLSALAANGNVRILSRPVIQAQNNQEASISIGEERPFIQVSQALPTDNGVRNEVVQYRQVATTLTISPTINPDGYVNLAISQEVNNATNEVQFGAPIITSRSAVTQLLAKDGQTVVIGGLIGMQEDRSRSGVPFLKDIPILGYLFGTTRVDQIQSELFLFLTPHIVSSDADADRIQREIELNSRLLEAVKPIRPLVRPIIRPDTTRGGR
jgi:type II secretory pathway component GspD/PulD (secretin)